MERFSKAVCNAEDEDAAVHDAENACAEANFGCECTCLCSEDDDLDDCR
jgi:hypothetical protein